MTIIIPMAGLSQRFLNEGFTLPKYMLYKKNKSLFFCAVNSFKKYFHNTKFIFIARDIYDSKKFIEEECAILGISEYSIVILDKPTQGQAETVEMGIEKSKIHGNEPILIFNIDTIRENYTFPDIINSCDGYLEVFKGNGPNWSYAKTENNESNKVILTAEKQEISDNCSTGIYYFKKASFFIESFNNYNLDSSNLKEKFVAPLYNYLIMKHFNIQINIINKSDVIFSGIPAEYYDFLNN
ncbi:capsular biosynthesis protein [Bacteroidota bacterium]